MARSPRLFIPGGLYHLYCRVARGEYVLHHSGEADEFLVRLAEIKKLHRFSVLGWCLMGNHYHLVVRTAEIPLWKSMARIQCGFARGFNRRRKYLGRLWQSRYKARVVDSEEYFCQVIAYVHLNPVAAGIVDDPCAYEHCGHGTLLGRRPPVILDVGEALRSFGDEIASARAQYLREVRAVAEARWLKDGIRQLPWWQTASSDDEVAAVTPSAVTFDGEAAIEKREPLTRPTLGAIAADLTNGTAVSVRDLRSRTRTRNTAEARIVFAEVAVERYSYSVGEVARFLGKHPSSVSRYLNHR